MEYKNRLTSTVKAFLDGDGRSIDDTEGRENAQKGIYRICNHLVDFYYFHTKSHNSHGL